MPKVLHCVHCGLMGELFHIISENECICINCHKINKISDMEVRQKIRQKAIAEMEKEAEQCLIEGVRNG